MTIWDIIGYIGFEKYKWKQEYKKYYNQYMINRYFSSFIELIEIIEELSQHTLTDEQHYNWLCDIIPVKNYRTKFKMKVETDKLVDMISDYYKISYEKAEEYYKILTPNDLKEIENHLNKLKEYGIE